MAVIKNAMEAFPQGHRGLFSIIILENNVGFYWQDTEWRTFSSCGFYIDRWKRDKEMTVVPRKDIVGKQIDVFEMENSHGWVIKVRG